MASDQFVLYAHIYCGEKAPAVVSCTPLESRLPFITS
jgi:hypothetical protein